MIEDTVNSKDTGRLYSIGNIEFFQGAPNPFVNRVR